MSVVTGDFSSCKAYDYKLDCQRYLNWGRNVTFLPNGELEREKKYHQILRIATWFTGIAPLIAICTWAVANHKAQKAVQERFNYWSSLNSDANNWDIPADHHDFYLNSDGTRKCTFASTTFSDGFASWLANTGVPKTSHFKHIQVTTRNTSVFSKFDGEYTLPPPPDDADQMLIIATEHGRFSNGDILCPTPDQVKSNQKSCKASEMSRIRSVFVEMPARTDSDFPPAPNYKLLQALVKGKTDPQSSIPTVFYDFTAKVDFSADDDADADNIDCAEDLLDAEITSPS